MNVVGARTEIGFREGNARIYVFAQGEMFVIDPRIDVSVFSRHSVREICRCGFPEPHHRWLGVEILASVDVFVLPDNRIRCEVVIVLDDDRT